MQSKCSRLLFLNNVSKNETIVFEWQLKPLDIGEVRVSYFHRIRTSSKTSDPPYSTSSYPILFHLTPSHPPVRHHPTPGHPIIPHPTSPHPILPTLPPPDHTPLDQTPPHPSPPLPTPSHLILSHHITLSTPPHPTSSCLPTPSHPCEAPETPSPNKQVSVSPVRGKVAPEETIPFVVTLKAAVHASFYSIDLVCKVGLAPEKSWDRAQLPVLRCRVSYEIPRLPERGRSQPLEEWGAHSTQALQTFTLLVLGCRCTSRIS